MKVRGNDVSVKFVPLDLTFTLETREEMDAMHALFNHVRTCDYVKSNLGIDAEDVRTVIDIHLNEEGDLDRVYFKRLCNKLKGLS